MRQLSERLATDSQARVVESGGSPRFRGASEVVGLEVASRMLG